MSRDEIGVYEWQRWDFRVSTDPEKLDVELIYECLSQQAYWATGRSYDTLRRSIDNSLCFGVYQGQAQVGFARVVTDFATFAWLCDVFIHEDYRGRGLGKCLLDFVLAHPDLSTIKRWALATSDAHDLYRQFGFNPLQNPE